LILIYNMLSLVLSIQLLLKWHFWSIIRMSINRKWDVTHYFLDSKNAYIKIMEHNSTQNQAIIEISEILVEILLFTHNLWVLNNSQQHGIDLQGTDTIKLIQLLHEIKSLYNSQDTLLSTNRGLFFFPFKDGKIVQYQFSYKFF